MGTLLQFRTVNTGRRRATVLDVVDTALPGVHATADRAYRFIQLKLEAWCPLTPYCGDVWMLGSGLRTVPKGVYEFEQRFIAVRDGKATDVSKGEAMIQLGAVEALQELGLADAAVALSMGFYENACRQWIELRDALRFKGLA